MKRKPDGARYEIAPCECGKKPGVFGTYPAPLRVQCDCGEEGPIGCGIDDAVLKWNKERPAVASPYCVTCGHPLAGECPDSPLTAAVVNAAIALSKAVDAMEAARRKR